MTDIMMFRRAGDLAIHTIAPGAHLYRGFFSNSAVLEVGDATVVVDTQISPAAGIRLRQAAMRVAKAPVSLVVNTHFHGDHTGGNSAFQDCRIVATDQTARLTVERDQDRFEYARTFCLEVEALHPPLPATETFHGRMLLHASRGEQCQLLHLGAAETPDACVVWIPQRGVIATGDGVSTEGYPCLGTPLSEHGLSDDGEWIRFLDNVRDLDPMVLLPGHGPALVGRAAIRSRLALLRRLFRDLMDTVKSELARGGSISEIVRRSLVRLRPYASDRSLLEHTSSQRFAVYRCLNGLLARRRECGWWADLRPSLIPAEERDEIRAAEMGVWSDSARLGVLAESLFNRARRTRPLGDAVEFLTAAGRCAKAAVEMDPEEPLALLNLGCVLTYSAAALGQPTDRARRCLQAALDSGTLTWEQRAKANYFLGRGAEFERKMGRKQWSEHLPLTTRWAISPLMRWKFAEML